MLALVKNKNKLFRIILKRIASNIDQPIPERRISNMLQVLFIFAFCFLSSIKPWGNECFKSNEIVWEISIDKSISMAQLTDILSKAFLQLI